MNVGGSAAGAIVETLVWVLQGLWWIVIIAALISWVNPDPRNPIVRFLWGITEPLFRPFRRIVPPSRMEESISPRCSSWPSSTC